MKHRNGWNEGRLESLPAINRRFHNMLTSEERRRMVDLDIIDKFGDRTQFKKRLPRCIFGWVEKDTFIQKFGRTET